jgi:hypothetical protein
MMTFAKWTFRLAGVYGLLLLTPMLFLEQRLSQDSPPAITHPEYFYGFLLATIAWQGVFLVISRDPLRYRPIMLLAATLEKFAYAIAVLLLFALGRVSQPVLGAGVIDLVLGALFVVAYIKTRETSHSAGLQMCTIIRIFTR